MEEENRNEDSGGRVPMLQLDSPWAWFYYVTFAIQLLVVSFYAVEREVSVVVSDSALETYVAILRSVSSHVPAMASYSLVIGATVEGVRMIAERYLARRFAEGKKRGLEEGRAEGLEEGRVEGIEEGRVEGVKQATAEYDEELARWLDANPTIKDAIESGEASPPPFLNGNRRE